MTLRLRLGTGNGGRTPWETAHFMCDRLVSGVAWGGVCYSAFVKPSRLCDTASRAQKIAEVGQGLFLILCKLVFVCSVIYAIYDPAGAFDNTLHTAIYLIDDNYQSIFVSYNCFIEC